MRRAKEAGILHLSRRNLLLAGGATLLGSVSGCDPSTEPGEDGEAEPTGGVGAKEAPMLAQLVDSGELPPLEERLPTEPLMVEPNDRAGVYGGDLNTVYVSSRAVFIRNVWYEALLRWNVEYTEVIPNIARDYEVNADGTQFTFMLREGMKWSDGAAFTADDLLFAYNDVLSNRELFPVHPTLYMSSGGVSGELEKVDDYTVTFTFASPYGMFLQLLATPQALPLLQSPRHYLEQFHPDYNSDVDQLAEDEGQPGWTELFFAKSDLEENVDVPRIHPWVPTNAVSESGESSRVVYERNPFYWKVDPDGRQLPYLDRVIFHVVSSEDVIVLMAGSGDLEMESRYIIDPAYRPVLAQSRESGDYHFLTLDSTISASVVLCLNLTIEDPVKREIFQNKDFRIGVSYAIDRQEIIAAVYQRQGEPYQGAPRPESPYYDEEMAKQYTEFDVDLANEHLDRAGFAARDADGFRLGPDGNRVSFAFDARAEDAEAISVGELIQSYLRDVGVDMQVEAKSSSLVEERISGNVFEASHWPCEGAGGVEPALRPDWWFPTSGGARRYAPQWMAWLQSGGDAGDEPPEEVKRQMEVYQDVIAATDEEQRLEPMRQLLQMAKDFFYHIGISLSGETAGIVKNNLHNVPQAMPDSWYYPTPGPTNPEQYFLEQGR